MQLVNTNTLAGDKLELSKAGGELHPQPFGHMVFSKIVQDVQNALILLKYDLYAHGADGLFGPETAAAISKFKKENNLLSESALSNIRDTISDLGYQEKSGQLSSGGNVTDSISLIIVNVLQTIKKELPNVKVSLTSGNDEYHHKLNYVSRHSKGEAFDFTIDPVTADNKSSIESILQRFGAGNPGLAYMNEYDHPSTAATAGHFHVSYEPNNPEGGKTYSSSNPIHIDGLSAGSVGTIGSTVSNISAESMKNSTIDVALLDALISKMNQQSNESFKFAKIDESLKSIPTFKQFTES